jgi:hypothetical protein
MAVRHGPHSSQEEEDDGVEHDRVRDGEEAGDCAGRPHGRRDGNEGVGGVEVATKQKPRGDRAEALTAQAPFVQRGKILGLPPAGSTEADDRDECEEHDQDNQGHPVDAVHRSSSLGRRCSSG